MNNKKIWEKMKFNEISILDIFNFFVALLSFGVAVIALINSKQIEMDVADYEFTLSQMPKVCILNQEFQIPLQSDFGADDSQVEGYNRALDFSDISEGYFPIKIPIYNIGTGLAQNCKVKLGILEQKNMALDCRDIFEVCNLNTYSGGGDNYAKIRLEAYLDNYIYIFQGEDFTSIEYRRGNKQEYNTKFNIDYINAFPYILPISEEKEGATNYFELSEEFSIFILEAIRQEMLLSDNKLSKPIEMKLIINYQDLKNNEYCSEYLLKFTSATESLSIIEPMIRMQLEVEKITNE